MFAPPARSRSPRLPELGKYEVIEEIGHGGMATVYRARDHRLARDVAVKVIHPHLRESTEVAVRFRGEAHAVAKLRHPNIVEVFDVSADDEPEQYLVVELLRGATLRKILKDGGELPPEVAASLAVELLGALAHAHAEGVVHRDIKPENVILEHKAFAEGATLPERVRVKLTDFGIAKLLDAQGVTSTGQVLGSPAHMAPEQIEGGEVDARADVFGLGVLLYECMVGHLPFEGANPAQVLRRVLEGVYPSAERERPKVGRAWSTILDGALAREPKDRFAGANAMRDAIVSELARVGVSDTKALLADYFDAPQECSAKLEEELVPRLAKLGTDARREGRHMDAASYTNRALAYAPNDPALLASASSLGRIDARQRALRRGVPIAAVMVTFAVIGYFGSRFFVRPPATAKPIPSRVVDAPAPSLAVAPSTPPPPPSAPTTAPLPAPPVVRTVASAVVAKAERELVVRSVLPTYGVTLTLDGTPVPRIEAGKRITASRDAHTIKLTCANDACEPEVRTVAPGEQDVELDIKLAMRPATLVVETKSTSKFQILEVPMPVFGPREIVRVPLGTSGKKTVTVAELSPPNRKELVELAAGKQSSVTIE